MKMRLPVASLCAASLCVLLCLGASAKADSDVKAAALFSDHMVLQNGALGAGLGRRRPGREGHGQAERAD